MEDKIVEGIKKKVDLCFAIEMIYTDFPKEKYQEIRDKLAQAIKDSLVINKDYLKDIIYCMTQHLDLPNKDVALLNGGLADALLRANLIKMKE